MMRIGTFLFLGILISPPLKAAINGTYFGGIQMDGASDQVATTLEAVVVQTGTAFQRKDIIVRLNFGGFLSPEYVTYHFTNPSWDAANSILFLDDSNLELSAALKLTVSDSGEILEGTVIHRLTQKKGKMRVERNDDDPAGLSPLGLGVPLIPRLSGEYVGTCGNNVGGVVQIETGKDASHDRNSEAGLLGYTLMGRLGYAADRSCLNWGPFPAVNVCSMDHYSEGLYRFYEGELRLQGEGHALDCESNHGALVCTHWIKGSLEKCFLKKKALEAVSPGVYNRHFFLNPTPDQKKPLPPEDPTFGSKELVNALNGNFYGFLHHENRDTYQLIQYSVTASATLDNDHLLYYVYVTPSMSAFFGRKWDADSRLEQEFERRKIGGGFLTAVGNPNLPEGYSWEGPEADTFLVIQKWQTGYIYGTWYSKSYGRIGTFELVKGVQPSIPTKINIVPALTGNYVGPTDQDLSVNRSWWVQMKAPGQIPKDKRSTVELQGEIFLRTGAALAKSIESGAFDMYTGSISWITNEEKEGSKKALRMFMGDMSLAGDLHLIWPGAPISLISMKDYKAYTYQRLP